MRSILALSALAVGVAALNSSEVCSVSTVFVSLQAPTVTVTVHQPTGYFNSSLVSSSPSSTELDAIKFGASSSLPVASGTGSSQWPLGYLYTRPSNQVLNTTSFVAAPLPTSNSTSTVVITSVVTVIPTLTKTFTTSRISGSELPIPLSRSLGQNGTSSTLESGLTATLSRLPVANETVLTLYVPGVSTTGTYIVTVTQDLHVPTPSSLGNNISTTASLAPHGYASSFSSSWVKNATTTSSATSSTEESPEDATPCPEEDDNAGPDSGITSSTSTVASQTTYHYLNVSSTSSASQSTATPSAPSVCGESGNFTLNWDDEPSFDPDSPRVDPWAPVFNPYHHMFSSNGYAYIPPGTDEPFAAISSPHLAIYLPNLTNTDVGSPDAAGIHPGEIGAGPRASIDAFWFDAFSVYVGCDNIGPDECIFTTTGYAYDIETQEEQVAVSQNVTVPFCEEGITNCTLTQLELDQAFRGLSGIQFGANVAGEEVIFLLDNLELTWSNNTCAAGLLRQRSRK